jgi:deoxyribodipyrimidine photo-lyase
MAFISRIYCLNTPNMLRETPRLAIYAGFTPIQRKWRNDVANQIDCPLIQIETDVIVPVEEVSNKEEYAAATIRSKIHKKLDEYIVSQERAKKVLSTAVYIIILEHYMLPQMKWN